jgi:hypothetical protein
VDPKPIHLTAALKALILSLATQDDIHSISCPFNDFDLWRGLLQEQVRRSQASGLAPQEALCLIGPSSGIRGVTPEILGDDEGVLPPEPDPVTGNYAPHRWGGELHVPYEGTTGADLFIVPDWHYLFPERLIPPNPKLHWVTYGKKCNYLLTNRDLGELVCATRATYEDWVLYKSHAPYMDCNPFHEHLFRTR